MKNLYPTLLYLLAGTLLLLPLSGCDKNNTKLYTVYEPIFASRATVLASINGNPAQGIDSAGKIYINGSYIFVNDLNKGIHVIDNTNPAHPVQTAFLSIPGNQDITIKGNTLYADMYDALLAIDISNPRQARVTSQLKHLFVMRQFVNGYQVTDDSVITGWTKKLMKTPPPSSYPCMNCDFVPMAFSASKAGGIAGSMAKMVLLKDHLYLLSESHKLQIINLDNEAQPAISTSIVAGFDLETIYPFQNKLFLGSTSGVYIYDLSNPEAPVANGTFWHGKACDPVIADGDYAYVTLHEGSFCGGAANELDVINVKDIANPTMVKAYPMTKPMGLSKDGNFLFVCDGPGVKIYDASDPEGLKFLQSIGGGTAYDVIASNNRLLISSDKGIYQYDYSRVGIPLLSVLPVGRH